MLLNVLIFSNRRWYFLISLAVIMHLVLTEANYAVLIMHYQINYGHTIVEVKVKGGVQAFAPLVTTHTKKKFI